MIAAMLEAAFAPMDKATGMYPSEWSCRKCGKQLNAGGLRPAELYAGTFTGLCYTCEASGPYVERTYPLDGAQWLSYPPSCPSWRRDRQTYVAYTDCATCNGTGAVYPVSYYRAGDRSYCAACSDRFYAHPVRMKAEARRTALYRAAENVWQSELVRIARTLLPKRAKKKEVAGLAATLARSPRTQALRDELLARYKRASARLAYYAEPEAVRA